MRNLGFLTLLLLLNACGGSSNSGNTVNPPTITPPAPVTRFTSQPMFTSLSFVSPVAMLQAPNDPSRWFVVSKTGTVVAFDNDPQVSNSTLFIGITTRVNSGGSEAGLLGMAFHPNFADNGEVFLSYTRNSQPLQSVISRFRSFDGGQSLDPNSEEIILTVQQDFFNHNGGNIIFGPDGFLYIGFGDGGSANDPFNRAQTRSTLLGKILRIDVDNGVPYTIPNDNPFAGNALCFQGVGNASCPEIFALGLRNPWRFSFDLQNGDLWAGDVGQDALEEIDIVVLGGNYGWVEREGTRCNLASGNCASNGFIDPVHEYDHSVGASVTGGYVYRGSTFTTLQGRYIFGDAVSGRVWALPANPQLGSESEELFDTDFVISSFAQDTNGEIFFTAFGQGTLHQIVAD